MRGKGVAFWVVAVFLTILVFQFVIGAYVARTFVGGIQGTQFNFNEDLSNNYTFVINNTETNNGANLTRVNVSLPTGFTFTSGTNSSSASGLMNFTNVGDTMLSWFNNSVPVVMNGSSVFFTINATSANPGFYNITIWFTNSSTTSSANISITINDTTPPSANFISPTPENASYLNKNNFQVNASVFDNWNVSAVFVNIYNSTHGLFNSSLGVVRNNSANFTVNFTNLVDGVYFYNFTVNDTFNSLISNVNNSATRNITIDTISPNVSLTLNTVSTSDFNIIVTITDGDGSGINGSCTTNRDSTADVSGASTSQTLTETNLNCAQTVSYTVTCLDRAGNSGSNTTSFVTNGCSSTSSSSSSSSSSTTTAPTNWSTTFSDSQTALGSEPISRGLSALQRTSILLGNEQHFVGIKSISGSTAVIEVSSTPQQGTLSVGQSKKFELNSDSYYDLLVTLVSINSGTANITMQSIHESLTEAAANNLNNASTNQTGSTTVSESTSTGIWVALIIVLLVVGGAAYYFLYYKRRPNYD